MKLRIGTRGSKLALWQAHHVRDRLTAAGAEVEIEVLVTRGDKIDDVPLQDVEGKAFFTKEIEDALLERRVDVAVHSHKDLPVESPPGLTIAAVPERAGSAERLLVAAAAHDASAPFLPLIEGARVGTSSPRRQAQVAALRPDAEILHLRGNVPTRVERLREGRYDAILLAAAGLDRLELDTSDLVALDLDLGLLVPAPGQGALAIQVREDDAETLAFVRDALHHAATETVVRAERELLTIAGGGCNLALGATLEPVSGDPAGWRARVFRGADATGPERVPRWASAEDSDPVEAARAALAVAERAQATGDGPLAGWDVALTGASSGDPESTGLGTRLSALGARVEHEQVVRCEDLEDVDVATAVAGLCPGDAVALTSRRAARRLEGITLPEGVLLGAVGASTAAALAEAGHTAEVVGSAGADQLGRALVALSVDRVLHPCAVDALPDLGEALFAGGVELLPLPVYRTESIADVELGSDAEARVYMSPSAVRAALEWERAHPTENTLRIALGASTAAALEEAELAAFTPEHGDREGIVRFLCARTERGVTR